MLSINTKIASGPIKQVYLKMAASPTCTPVLRAFQRLMAYDNDARLRNTARLNELANRHMDEVTVFSAHDPDELDRLAGAH